MPFEFSIDNEIDSVVICTTSVVGSTEFQSLVNDIGEMPDFEPGMSQLLDLSGGGVQMDGAEAQGLADFFQSVGVRKILGSGYRLAVVLPEPSHFGVARMFQAYDAEGHDLDLRVPRPRRGSRLAGKSSDDSKPPSEQRAE